MYLPRNLLTLTILTLPFAWLVAFVSMHTTTIATNISILVFSVVMLFFGLLLGGLLADYIRRDILLLVVIEVAILMFGIAQLMFPPSHELNFIISQLGIPFLFGCLGAGLIVMTIFLNQLVSSSDRGHVVGLVTVLALVIGGGLSLFWRYANLWSNVISGAFAVLFLAGLLFLVIKQPWRKELNVYMVPGSILPYLIWWIIFLVAYGLYAWATPPELRFLFQGFPLLPIELNPVPPPLILTPGRAPPELTLLAIGGATFAFTFLPDRIGRKRVFSVASVLLGELCIFAAARTVNPDYGPAISIALMVLEVFVVAFIVGVGAWLVWSEIGSVRLKGRRASLGWFLIAVTGIAIWISILAVSTTYLLYLLYPLAATLVLLSIFPLTTAIEVLGNERLVEELDISVDSRQVQRAIRELQVDKPLQRIQNQIETELSQITKIRGVDRKMAQTLRNEGYETPDLIASANPATLATILSITEDAAWKIKASAQELSSKKKSKIKKLKRKKKSTRK